MNDISPYLKKTLERMCLHRKKFDRYELDEQAVPAYLDGNFMSKKIFLARIIEVWRFIELYSKSDVCIDFGCGTGLMLPLLKKTSEEVYGIDLDLRFARLFLNDDRGYKLFETLDEASLEPGTVDLILVLDVLEHFEDPSDIIDRLAGLLRKGGILIISGPTENFFYKLGRALVGFSGHYHHQNIYTLQEQLCEKLSLVESRKIPWWPTLFEISCFEKTD